MFRAIKYRAYPTEEQSTMFKKTFGCCRKVWNLMLADKKNSYKEIGKFIATTPAQYKSDYKFLNEVDSSALANVQINLQTAFSNHFSKKRKMDYMQMTKITDQKYINTLENLRKSQLKNSVDLPG